MDKRKRIYHVITKLEMGGAQDNTIFTVQNLSKIDFESYLISGRGGILDPDISSDTSIRNIFISSLVREISPFRDLITLFMLFRIFRKSRPDIVHTHSSKAGILGRWAAMFSGVPFIIHTFHGFGFNDYQSRFLKMLYIFIEKLTAVFTDRLIFVSNANMASAEKYKIGKPERFILIRSGIRLNGFTYNQPDRDHVKKGPVVGMIACFKPQKAPMDFVLVAERVLNKIPSAKFLMVGDGVLRPQIEDLIRRKGIKESFHLTGWSRDIPGILSKLDIMVLTSLWEGLPRVVIESMASGVPVVATRVDGTSDVVKDGISGFLAPPRDVKTLAEKVILLWEDKNLYEKISKRAREIITAEFDIVKMVRDLEDMYGSLESKKI